MALYVVGCSDNKLPGDRVAFDKYAPRQHATMRTEFLGGMWAAGHDLAILSAKFGPLAATDSVPDYDLKMDARIARAMLADAAAFDRFAALVDGQDLVVVYGGRHYRRVVLAWCQRLGVDTNLDAPESRGAHAWCGAARVLVHAWPPVLAEQLEQRG